MEEASQHPIGQAISAAAFSESSAALPAIEGFASHDGQGVSAVIAGHAVLVGRARWLAEEWSLTAPKSLLDAAEADEVLGRTPVWVAWDGSIRGVIVVAVTVKDTSAAAIGQFRELGLCARCC